MQIRVSKPLAPSATRDWTEALAITYDRGGRQTDISDAADAHTLTFNVAGEMQSEQITGGILDGININIGYDSFLRRNSLQSSHSSTMLSNQNVDYDSSLI